MLRFYASYLPAILCGQNFGKYHKISELGKRKCQNSEVQKISPTKRVFYPKQYLSFDISIS